METWLINGEEPLPMDARLQSELRIGAMDHYNGGGIALNLGIVNLHGRIYRIVRTWDLEQYRRLCQTLERLEFRRLHNIQRLRAGMSIEDVFEWTPRGAHVPGYIEP